MHYAGIDFSDLKKYIKFFNLKQMLPNKIIKFNKNVSLYECTFLCATFWNGLTQLSFARIIYTFVRQSFVILTLLWCTNKEIARMTTVNF